jgi:acyl-coenzyme A thioesterase PaaI-like protein
MQLPALLRKARTSAFTRWWMNLVLDHMIPFNGPHGFRVHPQPGGGIRVDIPWWRVNRNHIRGIHACALATACEMCSGLSLLEHLDPKQYRLIMRSLRMVYHYQAKSRAHALCIPDAGTIASTVIAPLEHGDAVDHESTVEAYDDKGNHLATGTITWQVKPWSRVRTRV